MHAPPFSLRLQHARRCGSARPPVPGARRTRLGRSCVCMLGLILIAGLAQGSGLAGEEPSPDGEKPKTSRDNKLGFSDVDRSDPEALKRAVMARQEKLLKEKKKLLEKNKKKDSDEPPILVKNPKGGTPARPAGGESDTETPARRATVSLLKEGASTGDSERKGNVTLTIGMPKKGSLLDRMRSVMAAKRLEDGESLPYTPAPATVVELDVAEPLVPPGHTGPQKPASVDFFKEPQPPATRENIEEYQEEAERRFIAGLDARDTVLRDWSFRFGTANQRAEAIPAMVRELKNKGWLSTLAATGLGQIGQGRREVVDVLEEGLSSRDAGVRQACVHALGQLRAASAVRPISKLIRNERNFQVRAACCSTLGLIGGRGAASVLRQIFKTPDEPELVRAEAALALARLGDRSGLTYLEVCFGSPAPHLQLLGLTALIEIREPSLPSRLISALSARYEEVWLLAVRTLPSLGPGLVQPMLRETLGARLPQVRHRAALALGLLGDRQSLPYIQQALMDGGLAERQMAAELIGLLGHRESIPLLMERLRDPTSTVRVTAAVALTRLDAKEALPAIVEAARGTQGQPQYRLFPRRTAGRQRTDDPVGLHPRTERREGRAGVRHPAGTQVHTLARIREGIGEIPTRRPSRLSTG